MDNAEVCSQTQNVAADQGMTFVPAYCTQVWRLEQGKGTGTQRVAQTVPILSMIINIMMEAVVEL